MEKLLRRSELAQMFGVHLQTVIRWEKRGLPTIRQHTTVRYDIEQVKKWFGAVEPTSQKEGDKADGRDS